MANVKQLMTDLRALYAKRDRSLFQAPSTRQDREFNELTHAIFAVHEQLRAEIGDENLAIFLHGFSK